MFATWGEKSRFELERNFSVDSFVDWRTRSKRENRSDSCLSVSSGVDAGGDCTVDKRD